VLMYDLGVEEIARLFRGYIRIQNCLFIFTFSLLSVGRALVIALLYIMFYTEGSAFGSYCGQVISWRGFSPHPLSVYDHSKLVHTQTEESSLATPL
jgi:hypothetical protein